MDGYEKAGYHEEGSYTNIDCSASANLSVVIQPMGYADPAKKDDGSN